MASMAEWSKAADSSSVLFGGVGSNPTGCNFCFNNKKIIIYSFKATPVGFEPTRAEPIRFLI